jgi:hypothetical protein
MSSLSPCSPTSSTSSTSSTNRPRFDVGEIIRTHGQAYRRSHVLTPEQHKVLHAVAACRTAALGGHVDVCDACGHERPAYNSCRDRHCPKCQGLAQARWLEQRKKHILPTHYFHVVLTLPKQLRPLARHNPRQIYELLVKKSAQTLLTVGRDDKWLGAELGITSVLHTWTRTLLYHPHVHCIVTGGGLAQSPEQWRSVGQDFLFPVRVMSALFRGKFLAGLKRAHERGELAIPEGCADWSEPGGFERQLDALHQTEWVTYAKRPFGGPEQVYAYIGRYTHRVGLSNHRLVEVTDQSVCFKTKNGKTVTVTPEEFIRRFLLHVLPKGFVKIRHYGLMAPANVNTKLERARALLLSETEDPTRDDVTGQPQPENEPPDWQTQYQELTGEDLTRCPICHQGTMVRHPLPGSDASTTSDPAPAFEDSS